MNEITFDILKIVVSICAALVTVYVIPYLKTLKEDKRYASLVGIVEVAVRAAEQTIKEPGEGKLKKAEVEKFVSEWLDKQGIKITYDELDRLIECAVYQMKQGE
jgi:LL-H family phage holin